MKVLESWFPTITRTAERNHSWRMMPWWASVNRGCRQRSILQLLAIAHEQRLDPAPLLSNYAREQIGLYRIRVSRFARRVAEGTSIVEAVEQTPEVLGDEAVLAIRFGAQTGTLSQTYRDLIKTRDSATDQPQMKLQHTFVYSLMSLFVLAIVALFLTQFIFPTLVVILEDLGAEQAVSAPFAFRLLTSILEHLADHAPLYVLLGVAFAFLCWSAPTRRFAKQYGIPKWVTNNAQSQIAEILRLLAISLEAGRPVSSALSTLAHYHYDSQLRQKLLLARNQIEQGGEEWASLKDVRMLTAAESHALTNSSTKLAEIWTLRRLSDWKRGNALNQRDRAASLALPTITIVMAAVVLLFCSAMFSFLAYLIWSLA